MRIVDDNFFSVFNSYYPFDRYILKKPGQINYIYDDLVLTELFIPGTKIEPVVRDGKLVDWTDLSIDDIYVKLKTKAGEVRLAYFDFADHIQEEIRRLFMEDFGLYPYECLYIEEEEEDHQELMNVLQNQYNQIKEKYGECNVKENCWMLYKVEDDKIKAL